MHAAGTARVGRARTVAVATGEAPAQHADQQPEQYHQPRQQSAVDQRHGPRRLGQHLAQRIQPVQPGAQIVPGTFLRGRIAHHQPAMAGDVEQTAFGVRALYAVQRSLARQRMVARPGVLLDQVDETNRGATGELPRAGQRLGRTDPLYAPAAPCIDRDQRTLAVIEQVTRRAAGAGQAQTARRACAPRGRQRHTGRDAAIAGQRCQPRQVLAAGQLGIADVEHHHAADDPQQHEHAEGDAEPAVRQEQVALHAAQKSRVTAAYSARPSPGACSDCTPSYQTYS